MLISRSAYCFDTTDLTKKAEEGDAPSQEQLGVSYFKGNGVPKSGEDGKKWILKAAAQGYAPAQVDVGYAYQSGWFGHPVDYSKAIEYYQKAAAQKYVPAYLSIAYLCYLSKTPEGDFHAYQWLLVGSQAGDPLDQLNLAYCYERGTGVKKDLSRAAKWYYAAAQQRNPEALVRLGNMLFKGDPMPKDEKAAFHCFQLASLNNNWARTMLMRCYAEHKGTDGDLAEAYKWGLVMNNDDPESKNYFAKLKVKLTPEQIAEGQRRATAWLHENNFKAPPTEVEM